MRFQLPQVPVAKRWMLTLAALIVLTVVAIAFQRYVDSFASAYSTENRGTYLGSSDDSSKEERRLAAIAREKANALAKAYAEELTTIQLDESVEKHMERLIDLLTYRGKENDEPPASIPSNLPDGVSAESLVTAKRFFRVRSALEKLASYKMSAIPLVVAHLDDRRISIPLYHRCFNSSVGEMCNWNLRLQLQDLPQDYRGFPYTRTGRDGQEHDRSFQEETPFDDQMNKGNWSHEALKTWLEANKDLSYPQMQIKCLTWLLDKEKAIGAPDAESYFLNILPLEIQILRRRIECGENVEAELAALERRQEEKRAEEIPAELLPGKSE